MTIPPAAVSVKLTVVMWRTCVYFHGCFELTIRLLSVGCFFSCNNQFKLWSWHINAITNKTVFKTPDWGSWGSWVLENNNIFSLYWYLIWIYSAKSSWHILKDICFILWNHTNMCLICQGNIIGDIGVSHISRCSKLDYTRWSDSYCDSHNTPSLYQLSFKVWRKLIK